MTESRRQALLLAGVTLAGLGGAVAIAASGRLPVSSTLVMLAWAIGGAAVAGALCLLLLRVLHARDVTTQVAVAAMAPILVLAAGVLGAAKAMFISDRDLRALLALVLAAGTSGALVALLLGRRVALATARLGEIASSIARDEIPVGAARGVARSAPGELARLATELDRALARLAESRAKADTLERNRRELVAWVSHDLRTPLSGLRALVEALVDHVVEDEDTVVRYHGAMLREVERLTALVDDLFELSRIQAGALRLELASIRLDDLVGDVVASFADVAAAKGVRLRADVVDPAPLVELSLHEMGRALGNLVDNAIRHTPGGEVRIDAVGDETSGYAVVSVTDGCGGIPEDDLSRVFEVAFRGDAARSRPGGGLGLAVAQGLVEAHAGRITAENAPGGCRFSILLPLRTAAPTGS